MEDMSTLRCACDLLAIILDLILAKTTQKSTTLLQRLPTGKLVGGLSTTIYDEVGVINRSAQRREKVKDVSVVVQHRTGMNEGVELHAGLPERATSCI